MKNHCLPSDLQAIFLNELDRFEKITKFKIIHVSVYGSRMQGVSVDGSDWDIGIVYDTGEGYPQWMNNRHFERFKITHTSGSIDIFATSKVEFARKLARMDAHNLTILFGDRLAIYGLPQLADLKIAVGGLWDGEISNMMQQSGISILRGVLDQLHRNIKSHVSVILRGLYYCLLKLLVNEKRVRALEYAGVHQYLPVMTELYGYRHLGHLGSDLVQDIIKVMEYLIDFKANERTADLVLDTPLIRDTLTSLVTNKIFAMGSVVSTETTISSTHSYRTAMEYDEYIQDRVSILALIIDDVLFRGKKK